MTTTDKSGNRTLRGLLALSAASVAALGGIGLHTADAQGAAAVPTRPVSTLNLVQSSDFGSVKEVVGELNAQSSSLYGDAPVTQCRPYKNFEGLTGDKELTSLSSVWTDPEGESPAMMTEAVASASSQAQATLDAQKVLAALRTCQNRPAGIWSYGRVYHGPLVNGSHVWMDLLDGRGNATGGVAILLNGNRFAVVEVRRTAGDGDDAIKDALYVAEKRLVS